MHRSHHQGFRTQGRRRRPEARSSVEARHAGAAAAGDPARRVPRDAGRQPSACARRCASSSPSGCARTTRRRAQAARSADRDQSHARPRRRCATRSRRSRDARSASSRATRSRRKRSGARRRSCEAGRAQVVLSGAARAGDTAGIGSRDDPRSCWSARASSAAAAAHERPRPARRRRSSSASPTATTCRSTRSTRARHGGGRCRHRLILQPARDRDGRHVRPRRESRRQPGARRRWRSTAAIRSPTSRRAATTAAITPSA